jgi:hypothetical protein
MSDSPRLEKLPKPPTLPVQAHRAQRDAVDDAVVADVVDLERTVAAVAQHHVGRAVLIEVAEAGHLPIQSDRAHRDGLGDVVVDDVVDLEGAGAAVAQQHVGRFAVVEAAERDKRPIGPNESQLVAGEDRIAADIVDVVDAAKIAQDHIGGGAGRRGVGRRRHRRGDGSERIDHTGAGDQGVAERRGGLLEDLLDLRKGQRGIDLQHVGDDSCHAGRRRRSAEERVKHRRVDVVDAGDGDRAEKLRRVGDRLAVIVEPELGSRSRR